MISYGKEGVYQFTEMYYCIHTHTGAHTHTHTPICTNTHTHTVYASLKEVCSDVTTASQDSHKVNSHPAAAVFSVAHVCCASMCDCEHMF